MSAGSVCVVGSFMMDLAFRAARRPAPGETLVGSDFQMFLGGKGFNQAVAAARAGARTALVGRVGADDFGRQFLARLEDEAIDATHVVVDEHFGTGVGLPLTEDSGENSIVIVPRANDRLRPGDIERAAPLIARAGVLLLQMELPFDTALAAARIARRSDTIVVLNPAPAPADEIVDEFRGLVDVLVPNECEARALCGAAASVAPLMTASQLWERLGVPVVMTLGGQGCVVVAADTSFEISAHSVPVVDTVGAGDAFCGALGAWLNAGASLREAVVYANAAGALAVTRAGAEPAMPKRQVIIELAEANGQLVVAAPDRDRSVTP
jgi:ribokinase